MLVVAKRFQGQREQERFFFGKHDGDLPFGGAVDARIGAASLPAIQIGLRLLQTLEAFSFEWGLLGMSDPTLDFPLAIGIVDPTR
jgi:hypothetical protein